MTAIPDLSLEKEMEALVVSALGPKSGVTGAGAGWESGVHLQTITPPAAWCLWRGSEALDSGGEHARGSWMLGAEAMPETQVEKGPPGERSSGKGSAAGRPEWAWDSREQREAVLDGRTAPGATGLAAIRAHQSREPLDLLRYCRGRKRKT